MRYGLMGRVLGMADIHIRNLIEQLKAASGLANPVDAYLHGGCLLFARMLKARCSEGEIVYLPEYLHFVYLYRQKLYDATGNVSRVYAGAKRVAFADVPEKVLKGYC